MTTLAFIEPFQIRAIDRRDIVISPKQNFKNALTSPHGFGVTPSVVVSGLGTNQIKIDEGAIILKDYVIVSVTSNTFLDVTAISDGEYYYVLKYKDNLTSAPNPALLQLIEKSDFDFAEHVLLNIAEVTSGVVTDLKRTDGVLTVTNANYFDDTLISFDQRITDLEILIGDIVDDAGNVPFKVSFLNQTSVIITHNKNTDDFIYSAFDASFNQLLVSPDIITNNSVTFDFGEPTSGKILLFLFPLVGGVITDTVYKEIFVNETTLVITHNKNSQDFIQRIVDDSGNELFISPTNVTNNQVTYDFQQTTSGKVILKFVC